jgi:hypothetical protein
MSDWQKYRRTGLSEMRPYIDGEDVSHISISEYDRENGSPKAGDMIARNPRNHTDQWLVAAKYFAENLEPAEHNDAAVHGHMVEAQRARAELAALRERVASLPLHIPDGTDEYGRWKWITSDNVAFWGNLTSYYRVADVLAALENTCAM